MKKILLAIFLIATLAGFTSCEDDEQTIYDRITGRFWVGDLGFYDGPYRLESGVYFGTDGFGTDELCYFDNGKVYAKLNMRWDAYDGTIYIDYGHVAPPRELRFVNVRWGLITGTLYIDGRSYGPVTLEMR